MSIDLVALAPGEGWAIYRDGGQAYLLRPPLAAERAEALRDAEVDRAVLGHGFEPQAAAFDTVQALIEDLRERLRQSPMDGRAEAAALFATFDEGELSAAMHRVETQYVATRRYDEAAKLLAAMAASVPDSVTRRQVTALQKQCEMARKTLEAGTTPARRERFALAFEVYGQEKLAAATAHVQATGQVLPRAA
ncbi:MAG: hypothetical protein IT204_24215 [Fimbriimonadaceae bacterium]|nr:hypothetical protein [Fimbriimonadaceae bacterium]